MFQKSKQFLARVAVGAVALVASVAAHAVAIVDYSGAVTAATSEITASTATGVTLFGTVLAIAVGLRIMKKFSKG